MGGSGILELEVNLVEGLDALKGRACGFCGGSSGSGDGISSGDGSGSGDDSSSRIRTECGVMFGGGSGGKLRGSGGQDMGGSGDDNSSGDG